MALADEHNVHSNSGSVAFSILASVAWAHQRESLLGAVERLEQAAVRATSDEQRNCYTIATILCTHAASEAFLNEWAKKQELSTYEETARGQSNLLRTAEELLPKIGGTLSADLIELANAKNALCNPEPERTHCKVNGHGYVGPSEPQPRRKPFMLSVSPELSDSRWQGCSREDTQA